MDLVPLPDRTTLRQLLDYEPETGLLKWRPRSPEMFDANARFSPAAQANMWNGRYAGKDAFTCDHTGYKSGRLLSKRYLAHRLIWKWLHGDEPDEIDHIDHCRSNNRADNLRAADKSINQRNGGCRSNNTSGQIGVSYNKRDKCWTATVCGKLVGNFKMLEDAVIARRDAEAGLGFHENHGL